MSRDLGNNELVVDVEDLKDIGILHIKELLETLEEQGLTDPGGEQEVTKSGGGRELTLYGGEQGLTDRGGPAWK